MHQYVQVIKVLHAKVMSIIKFVHLSVPGATCISMELLIFKAVFIIYDPLLSYDL